MQFEKCHSIPGILFLTWAFSIMDGKNMYKLVIASNPPKTERGSPV